MQERRKERRQRTLKIGKIVFNDCKSVFDCRIRDLTEGGARLRLDLSWLVPRQFQFAIAKGPGRRRKARVVWRGDAELGVAFD